MNCTHGCTVVTPDPSFEPTRTGVAVALPTFKTERLSLRQAIASDLNDLWSLWNDPNVRRFLFDNEPVSVEQPPKVLESCAALSLQGIGMWLVEPLAQPRTLGCVALLPTTVAAEYDLSLQGLVEPLASFALGVWGQGYAREALAAVIAYAFDTLRLPMLAAVNDVPNEASDRMLRAFGSSVQRECQGPRYRLQTYCLAPAGFEAACR